MRYDQWLQVRLGLLACYKGHPVVSNQVSSTAPEYSSVWLVHRGRATVELSGKTLYIDRGQGVLLPPGLRKQHFSKDVDFHSISFFADWPDGTPLFPKEAPLIFERNFSDVLQILDHIHETFSESVSENTFYSFREEVPLHTFLDIQEQLPRFLKLLLRILEKDGVCISKNRELDARVLRAIDIMETHPWETGALPLKELSSRCGSSSSHLDRLFRLQLDTSPIKWMNRLRLRKAKRLLQTGGLPVKHIAYEMGFRSLAHFSRWYKEQTGWPPSEEKTKSI